MLVLFMVSFSGFAQTHGSDHENLRPTTIQLDSILNLNITPVSEQIVLGIW